jgi:hypothetical protein
VSPWGQNRRDRFQPWKGGSNLAYVLSTAAAPGRHGTRMLGQPQKVRVINLEITASSPLASVTVMVSVKLWLA